jgi:deaminated glutathione amidase
MDRTFKVACVQNCAADNLEANIVAADALVREAASAGASLICLPEYFCILERTDTAYFDNGFDAAGHPALAHFQRLAKELQAWLLLGSVPIKSGDRKVHNRSHLIAPDGGIEATYDKVHLFDVAIRDGQDYRESSSVAPGDRAVVADLPWGRLGLTICYDVRFPHLYRQLAKAGAHFISVPAAFTAKTGEAHWHTLIRARAIENACYIFAPDQPGRRPWGRRTYGHSLIVDPWGTVLADGGEQEGYIVADIDPARVDEARRMIPALTHDRPIKPAG